LYGFPSVLFRRNTFTFTPDSQSNTLWNQVRDRKLLYIYNGEGSG